MTSGASVIVMITAVWTPASSSCWIASSGGMCQPSAGTSSTWKWASITGSGTCRHYRRTHAVESQTECLFDGWTSPPPRLELLPLLARPQRSPCLELLTRIGGRIDALHHAPRRDPCSTTSSPVPRTSRSSSSSVVRCSGAKNYGLVNDGFRENFRLLSLDAHFHFGPSDVPERGLHDRGLGRRRRRAARRRRRARAPHLDGRHDRARVRLQVPRALHRRLPRCGIRTAMSTARRSSASGAAAPRR